MNKNAFRQTAMLILVLLPLQVRGQDNTNLAATVTLHKMDLLVGEPLHVKLVITNQGIDPVSLYYMAPQIGAVFISNDGKQFYRNIGELYPRMRRAPLMLRPTQAVTSYFTVLWSLWYERGTPPERVKPDGWAPADAKQVTDFAFPKPGTYFVQGGYEDTTSTRVKSTSVPVTVKDPTGDDLIVWTQLKGMPAYAASMQSGTAAAEAVEGFAKIVQGHTNSVYTPYLALSLARYYQAQSDPTKTTQYAQLVTQASQNAWIREEGFFLWAGALIGDDTLAAAKAVSTKALQDYPDGRYKRAFQWTLTKQPAPKDPMQVVRTELKALGYDLSVFDTNTNLFEKWFDAAIVGTEQAISSGKIAQDQFDTEMAARTKTFVLTNLVPTLTLTNSLLSATNSVPTTSP